METLSFDLAFDLQKDIDRDMLEDATTELLQQYIRLVDSGYIDTRVTTWESWYYHQVSQWLQIPEHDLRHIAVIRQILQSVDL